MATGSTGVVRALGRMDLILLNIVALVNINNVPPVAVYGKASLLLWLLAFAAFFLPEAVAVLALSKRYPGEGGVYLWIRQEFDERHGFLAGWCYWVNNLFYVPVLLVYMAGILAFAGSSGGELVESRGFVALVAFGWLGLIAVLNVRGLGVGKWVQNVGGIGTALSIGLVLVAALVALTRGVAETPPLVANAGWGMAASFAVMCNAMVGIELASTMGDEIRNPARDLRPAILIGGGVMLLSYLLVTAAVLGLVPIGELGVVQGIMQALQAGASEAGLDWMVAPVALLLALSIGGAASAWFAGTSRVPFVAGLTSALPAALGKVHPRWHSPHVALWTCAVLAACFTAVSMVGSTVAEAYQVLLKAAVVIQLVPFLYLFLALARLGGVGPASRAAGMVGLLTTAIGIVVAFLPTDDVASVALFEAKMAVGVLGPIGVGWWLFRRSDGRTARRSDGQTVGRSES
jgi:glutamate:GABA antiporter